MPFTLTTFLLLVFVYTQLIIFGGAQSRKYDFPILKCRKGRTSQNDIMSGRLLRQQKSAYKFISMLITTGCKLIQTFSQRCDVVYVEHEYVISSNRIADELGEFYCMLLITGRMLVGKQSIESTRLFLQEKPRPQLSAVVLTVFRVLGKGDL